MKILKSLLLSFGYYLEKTTKRSEILDFIKMLKPYSTEHELIIYSFRSSFSILFKRWLAKASLSERLYAF